MSNLEHDRIFNRVIGLRTHTCERYLANNMAYRLVDTISDQSRALPAPRQE